MRTLSHTPVLKDLLLNHPSPDNLHIMPTTRDPNSQLALSSRNAYLTPAELSVAPALYHALSSVKAAYEANSDITAEEILSNARASIESIKADGVDIKLDYIQIFNKDDFELVSGPIGAGRELVVAGAMWVGKTRLIDNLLLGWKCD